MAVTRELVSLRGRAVSAPVNEGTASEHTGVVLETDEGERVVLVRLGGNPFDDQETRQLAGRELEVKGYRIGPELRYVEAKPRG